MQEIATDVEADPGLQEEASIIHHVLTQLSRYQEDRQQNSGQKWKLPPNGQPICLFSGNVTATKAIIRPDDDSKLIELHYVCLVNCIFFITLQLLQLFFEFIAQTIPIVHYGFQLTLALK